MKYAPDEGWAWAVTFAGFVINLVVAGIGRMAAVFYVAIMQTYGVNRKQAITPFTTRSAVKNLFGPVVGILGQRFGVRGVVVSGGVTSLVGFVLCYFTQDLFWITIFFGVFAGIGSSLCCSLIQLVVDKYFKINKTTASGFSLAGSSIGSIVFPVVISFILSSYGVQGTFLLMGGIFLHVIPSAIVMKEPPWVRTKRMSVRNSASHSVSTNIPSYSTQQTWYESNGKICRYSIAQDDGTIISSIHSGNALQDKFYGSVNYDKGVRTDDFKNNLNSPTQEDKSLESPILRSYQNDTKLNVCIQNFKVVLKTLKNTLRINLSPPFQFIRLSRTASYLAVSPISTVIIDVALDKGIEKHKAVYMVSVLSVGELLDRMGFGLITDRNYVSMEFFMGVVMILQGICMATIPIVTSFVLLLTGVMIFELLQGVVTARYPVLVIEYTKLEDQYIAMGSISILITIVAFLIPHFVGYFRDTVGSYDGVFFVASGVIIFMGILWLILPRLLNLKPQEEKILVTEPQKEILP